MSSRRRKTGKKNVIKKSHFTRPNNFPIKKKIVSFISSIKYKSIIKDVFNRLLYFFLIFVVYPISSTFIVVSLGKGNLNYLQTIIIFFAFIVNLISFAKIMSLRTNWTFIIKYPHVLPWKDILLKRKFFSLTTTIILTFSLYNSIYDNFMIAYNHPYFWTNPLVAKTAITFVELGNLFGFEIIFWCFVLSEKFTSHVLKKDIKAHNATNVKNSQFIELINNKLKFFDSATYQPTDSKIVLVIVLIGSIIFAKIVSDQINNYFLDLTSFNFSILFFSAVLALLFSTYFMISLNILIFKKFKWEHDIDIRRNIPILLFCFFIFMNAIYFAKYLAVFMFYIPIDANDPATIMLSKTLSPAGKPWLEDKFFVALTTFMDYITFSIISSILAYIIFFVQTSKKHIMEVLEEIKRIILSSNKPNSKSNVIEKLFSKQLRNQNFVKYYSLFFYIYIFGIEAIFAFILFFYAKYDDMFGAETFKIAVNRFIYETIIYTSLLPVLGAIYSQSQVYYQYPLRHFISRSNWQNFVKILLIYYPIVFLYPITIFINDVYRISKQYGNIVPSENIQVMQSIFSVFVLGFLSINIYPKIEEFLMNLYDHDFYN
ncbi:hypothetical protein DU43_18420 [Methanosarcina mazei]|uniref:Uncharacterized protein n=1 Tax=Methanosarcina mazei TaxID=2209 RepID=A0A0F8HSC5_METMZ|nr:hypothetical protein [Methanosarcina mazei]KKG69849.1 hypothetical protein DU43_18420 [Methanosarcina mazei]